MKVAILASAASIHTQRWAEGLAETGLEIHIISCHRSRWCAPDNVTVHFLANRPPLGYFSNARAVRKLLGKISPQLLHAHYASGYGTLARFSRFSPLLLSVWGSDIYRFPRISPLHRYLVVANIRYADAVASTSHAMASEVRNVCGEIRQLAITPFGIDVDLFSSFNAPKDLSHIQGKDW